MAGEEATGAVGTSAAKIAETANLAGVGEAAGTEKAEKGVAAAETAETASVAGRQHGSIAEAQK